MTLTNTDRWKGADHNDSLQTALGRLPAPQRSLDQDAWEAELTGTPPRLSFMTKAEKTIRDWLAVLVHKQRRKPEWCYGGSADFLLQHGVMFLTKGGHATGHYPRACYAISRRNTEVYPDYLYAEGFALDGNLPTEHAWNVRPDGTILDMAFGRLGGAYFGVAFRVPRLLRGHRPSFLDYYARYKSRHPVYAVPWVQNRFNPSGIVSNRKRKAL